MATKKTAKKEPEVIEIKEMKIEEAVISIEGDTPFIIHKWSEKAKKEMLDKQMGVKRAEKKSPKNPIQDFIDSFYWITDSPKEYTMEAFEKAVKNGARFGFPATAVKQCMQSAAYRCGWEKNQMGVRSAVFIVPDFGDLVEIQYEDMPVMREDMVKINLGTADIRYRGSFEKWRMNIHVKYNSSMYSLDYLVNVLNASGFMCGLGEWRMERDGQFGMFHVTGVSK